MKVGTNQFFQLHLIVPVHQVLAAVVAHTMELPQPGIPQLPNVEWLLFFRRSSLIHGGGGDITGRLPPKLERELQVVAFAEAQLVQPQLNAPRTWIKDFVFRARYGPVLMCMSFVSP